MITEDAEINKNNNSEFGTRYSEFGGKRPKDPIPNSESRNSKYRMKCPNPECGEVFSSPYHTICPVCAEPFPIEMLYQESRQTNIKKILFAAIIIVLMLLVILFLVFKVF